MFRVYLAEGVFITQSNVREAPATKRRRHISDRPTSNEGASGVRFGFLRVQGPTRSSASPAGSSRTFLAALSTVTCLPREDYETKTKQLGPSLPCVCSCAVKAQDSALSCSGLLKCPPPLNISSLDVEQKTSEHAPLPMSTLNDWQTLRPHMGSLFGCGVHAQQDAQLESKECSKNLTDISGSLKVVQCKHIETLAKDKQAPPSHHTMTDCEVEGGGEV
ncbi:unnamed protein product [Pleuronectes platessa]|uniref:Uncharacterized protein n=1 Tax=Pleuronectes platessa TaxID=8262 RepID=A0A9N7TS53_PLEPL|nr:unnamed protein product [Pleuronectes platessa]